MSFTQTSWAKNARRNPIQAQHEEVVECKGLRLGVPLALGSVVRSAANFLFILNQEQTVKSRAGGKATTPAYPLRRNTSTPEILLGQPTKLEKLPLGTPQEGAMGHLFMVRHPGIPRLRMFLTWFVLSIRIVGNQSPIGWLNPKCWGLVDSLALQTPKCWLNPNFWWYRSIYILYI